MIRGLMVMMPDSQVGSLMFESLLDPHNCVGLVAVKCVALYKTIYGTSATERPIGNIRKKTSNIFFVFVILSLLKMT